MPKTFSYEDAVGDAPTAAPKTFSFEEATGQPAPQPSALSKIGESFADIPREIGHEFMEGSRAVGAGEHGGYDPQGRDKRSLIGFTPREMQITSGVAEQLGSLVTGPLTSGLGRPIETGTGGKVKKETVGNIASMAVPVVGEGMEAMSAGRLASELGISETAAKAILAKAPVKAAAAPGAAGRQGLAHNVRALQALGVEPSLAVASTGKGTRAATQAVGQNYFAGPMVRKAVDRTAKGFRSALDQAVGPNAPSAASAGETVKHGLERFSKTTPVVRQAVGSLSPESMIAASSGARSIPSRVMGFGNKSENLYGRAEAMIGPSEQPIPLAHTRAAMHDIMQEFHDPGLRDLFQNSKLRGIFEAVEKNQGQMTWNDATKLRTKIRETLKADPALRHTVSDAQVDGLYSSLTKDLQEGAGKLGGPKAQRAYEQANQFYRTGMDRINTTLSKYYGPHATNESVFHDLVRSAQDGGRSDLKRLNQVRHSLSPDEWHEVQSGVIDQMGRALPGQRTPETDFSFSTFLTNFNKLDTRGARAESDSDSGLKALFGGRESQLPQLRKMANVAGQMRELDKLRNNSQSGAMLANLATGSFLATEGLHHPMASIGVLMTGNLAAKALESPMFVRWLSGVPEGDTGGRALYESMHDLAKMAQKDPELSGIYHQLRAGLIPVGAVNPVGSGAEEQQ